MYQDKGPRYTLGFGIRPSNAPIESQPEGTKDGPNPTGGLVARALYDHPVAKFFAVSAATMVGMGVASSMVRRGGVRLGEKLAEGSLPFLRKESQAGLLHQFRDVQGMFDEWEGVHSAHSDPKNLGSFIKRDSFFIREAERAHEVEQGFGPTTEQWMFRNELQQRLVHQARSLPYMLPALYVSNRAANTLVGDPNSKVNWSNPFDVVGDFAESSIKNLAGLVAPFEVGHGALKHGWRRVMADGDFAANTTTFSPHIRSYGVGLKIVLDRMGQDAVDLLHQTTRRSAQSAGAFANALDLAAQSKKPLGVSPRDEKNTRFGVKRFKLMHDAYKMEGWQGAAREAVPTLSGFAEGFGITWREHDHIYLNTEAARKGETTYTRKGKVYNVDLNKIQTNSYVTQLADFMHVHDPVGDQRAYDTYRKDQEYRKLLQEEVSKSLAHGEAVGTTAQKTMDNISRQFVRHIEVKRPSQKLSTLTNPRADLIKRVSFGTEKIFDSDDVSWESQFRSRIAAVVPGYESRISNRLQEAVTSADRRFQDNAFSADLTRNIRSEWRDIRERVLIPEARRQLGETALPHELFGLNATKQAQELLVRRTAQEMGISLQHGQAVRTTADLRADLQAIGLKHPHQMKAILTDQGVISKPWDRQGFNFFGLRPLTAQAALKKNYFNASQKPEVERIFDDIGNMDHPYVRGLVNRPVGRHVWESRSGRIVDLNPTIQSLAKVSQVVGRHVEIPFLHFSPIDLTSFNTLNELVQRPVAQIVPATNINFGPLRKQLPSEDYDSHIWIRGSRGFRGRGRVFGYRRGQAIGEATGEYYNPSTMGMGTWARNLRIAMGDKGLHMPPTGRADSDPRERARRFFRQDPEQHGSIIDLGRRIWRSQPWRRVENRDIEDIDNPAILAGKILRGDIPDRLTPEYGRAYTTLDREMRQSKLLPAVVRNLDSVDEDLAKHFKIGETSLSSVKSAREMFDLAQRQFRTDLASATTQEQRSALKAAQGFVQKVYLDTGTPDVLGTQASRGIAVSGINTRLDEMRAELYRYLATSATITSGEDSGQIIQKLLDAVQGMSDRGLISGAQYTEARVAALSMQANLLGLGLQDGGERIHFDYDLDRIHHIMSHLGRSNAGEALRHISEYDTRLLHHNRFFGLEEKVARPFLKRFGISKQRFAGTRYNPFGGEQDTTFVPTFGTSFWQNPVNALKSAAGFSTWSDPDAFSATGIRTSHLAQRLNRYFQMLGVGVDEAQFKGPMGFINLGLVGRRVFPGVAAAAVAFGLDRELGGAVRGKDQYGNRQYTPLVSGAIATGLAYGDVLAAGVLHGPSGYDEKYQQMFGDEDVPIRRGRFWPLGNQPWRGGRVMYYRPNWYRRFMSGYQYTDEEYGSPAERLAFDYDFSPLHYVDPYHFERKHFNDRPYPVSGDLFTGPWGPLTSELNATVGRVLKPHVIMHGDELDQALANYQRVGQYGMVAPGDQNPYPQVLTRSPSGGATLVTPSPAEYYLGEGTPGGGLPPGNQYGQPYNQPYGFLGFPYGTHPDTALSSYRGGGGGVAFGPGDADTLYTSQGTVTRGGRGAYNRVYMARAGGFDQRVIPAANPINPGKSYYQAGQFGYEAEEMAGIYGFGFGTAREQFGFGNQNFTPRMPVLTPSSRAYGAERSFWDMNLGGFGDFPTPLRGEYGNIEFSEIGRRFIPHRRREMTEINPLPNEMAEKYPWLPGNDYFTNFDIGDPYAAIPEGELRLPGAGYERAHELHPDETGEYGLLDKHRILGNTAPWSEEYRAIDRIVRRQQRDMSPEDQDYALTTRRQVAQIKKRHNFYPYKYAHADFKTTDVKVTGFMPGDADQLITNQGVIKLAGVRARRSPDALALAQNMIHAGDTISIKYDANAPQGYKTPTNAQITTANGQDFGQALLDANLGYASRTNTALDNRIRQGPVSFQLHRLFERAAHTNNLITQKFYPHRSAVEDWERYHVYGTDFPQWSHPFRDFIEPLGQRARNRNPVYAAAVLNVVGSAFGRTPQGKTAGRLIGTGLGAWLSLTSNAKTLETGQRYIPGPRVQENAIDENVDILNYVKYARLYTAERQAAIDQENSDPETYARRVEEGKYKQYQFTNLGPHTLAALDFRKKMKQTEYGTDLFGDIMQEAMAVPKRKRDYFMEFINAPMNERPRILSTAPRLERRLYEARWGLQIEERPDLTDYFSQHELPGPDWQGWDPNVNLGDTQLKMIQQQGLDASQMGYFPQQIQEANLINPSYPDFNAQQSKRQAANQLRQLMQSAGISGDVIVRPTSGSGTSINLQMGTYA